MTSASAIFMFSGQGSQYIAMGRDLFEQDDVFRVTMRELDVIAQAELGVSVVTTIYRKPAALDAEFSRTLFTHPAIFMVEYALAKALMARGIKPKLVLSTSLGIFAAAAIAGCLDARDGLLAAIRQAQCIEAYCPRGGMIAILESVRLHERHATLRDNSELVGDNLDDHFVVSVPGPRLQEVMDFLRVGGISHQKLAVSHAFHSVGIEPARAPFDTFCRGIAYRRSNVPVVCCAQVQALSELSAGHLWNAVRAPIQFRQTLRRLEDTGPQTYIDVGPSSTLSGFVRRGLGKAAESTCHAVMSPFGGDFRNMLGVADARSLLT